MNRAINGINLGYTDQGQGHALVFIHAFPLSQKMWEAQVNAFSDRYRVITVDLRGHGESDSLLWNFSLDDYAHDIRALLTQLNIEQATFIGLSMGGYTLFSLYRQYPELVKGLVLADTRAQADNEEGKAGRKAMAQVAYEKGPAAIAEMMIPKLLAPHTVEQRQEIVERVRSMILANQSTGIIVGLMAMAARLDSTTMLSKISCPTLVIVGEEDVATPPSESQYMVDRIPHAQLVTIPDAGHLSNFEQPDVFNRAVEAFLNSQ